MKDLKLTPHEQQIVEAMRVFVALRSDADVVRLALYRFAEFLRIDGLTLNDFTAADARPRRKGAHV